MLEIYSLTSWQFWTYFFWFGIATFLTWFLVGLLALSFTNLKRVEQFYLSPVVGIVFWALQGYLFGWIQLRWLTWFYLGLVFIGVWRRRRQIFPLVWKIKLTLITKIIIVLGSLCQLTPMFFSGTRADDGIQFFFVNIFDGIFHLSLTRSLVESVPPVQPGAVGLLVTNYHYLSNLTVAEMARIWSLPISHLYFQFLPTFFSFWFGIIIVLVIKRWTSEKISIIFSLVLFYFSGEMSWFFNNVLGAYSQVPFEVFVDHGMLQFLNPPQAFAKLVFLSSLIMWTEFWKKKSWIITVLLGVMFGCLVGFKVYFGFLAGLGLIFVWVLTLFKLSLDINNSKTREKLLMITILGLISLAISVVVYLPTNKSAGGLFFSFLAWPKLLLGAEKIWWNEWWLRLQVYEAANNLKALVIWYGMAVGIFLMSIFHFRLFGLISIFKKFRDKMNIEVLTFLFFPSIVCLFLGMNFLQTSGGFNTFNFLVVSLVPLNILTALSISGIKARAGKWLLISILAITVIQSFPLQYHFIHNTILRRDRQVISAEHESALNYIKNNKLSGLQTIPHHYLDETTPYLYFFTGYQSYFGGRGILDSHNQAVLDRKEILKMVVSLPATVSAQLALDHGIKTVLINNEKVEDQIFFNSTQVKQKISQNQPFWKVIYKNKEVTLIGPQANQ